jgi:hypothetical protein
MGAAVVIATGYGLDSRRVGDRVSERANFFTLHFLQTGSRSHPASGVTLTLSPGVKWSGREADHSPTGAEVSMYGSTHPFPHTSSWRSA